VEEGLRKMLVKPEVQSEVIADSNDSDSKLYKMDFGKKGEEEERQEQQEE